jgi:hypothetical protein
MPLTAAQDAGEDDERDEIGGAGVNDCVHRSGSPHGLTGNVS